MNTFVTLTGGLADNQWLIGIIILAFFAVIVLAIVLIKRKVKPLQIKKDEMTEEEVAKEELDRILVPVDEETQKQMDEAAKKADLEDDK